MNVSHLLSLHVLSTLLTSRYFRFLSWILVAALIASLGITVLLWLGTVRNLELSLLDVKIRYRASADNVLIPNHLPPPSEDIVLVGLDTNTDKFIRANPGQYGLTNLTLPRATLAQLVNHLVDQGAKAIVFDLEFKEDKAGDDVLAQAIRRHPRTYAAARMDYVLDAFTADQKQALAGLSAGSGAYHQQLFLFSSTLTPYVRYWSELHARLLPSSGLSPLALGLTGPVYRASPLSAELTQLVETVHFRHLQHQYRQSWTVLTPLKPPELLPYENLAERAYSQLCTEGFYNRAYHKTPRFLSALRASALNVHMEGVFPLDAHRGMTHCYTHPVTQSILDALTSIGIPSIDYYDDAYIRSASVLYRGYQGRFYTYLGIRPVLDLLNIQTISYTPKALTLDGRRIPLIDSEKVLINWRDPQLLVRRLFEQHGLDPAKLPSAAVLHQQWMAVQQRLAPYERLENWSKIQQCIILDPYVEQTPERQAQEAACLRQEFQQAGLSATEQDALRQALDAYRTGSMQVSREQVLQDIAAVNGARNNPLLGGGHLYRMISAIDLLRMLEGESLPRDVKSRLRNIPYYPQSGEFTFKDKIVIIGNTVTDIHRTPISNTMFGPEVVAAVLDMVRSDQVFIQKMPLWMEVGAIILLGSAITVSILTFSSLSVGFAVSIILVILYWLLDLLAFYYLGYWLDLIIPTLVLGFALAVSTLYRYYVHDREKNHLTNVFSKYVSPQIMGEIVKNPARALDNLKGGKKELTVLFSDLQNFTQQFADSDPEEMIGQLNEYFDVMTEIILRHGGTYDKYMGDSIMAFFGAPTNLPEHAAQACLAAIEMQQALQTLNQAWQHEGRKTLAHGIGIASGEMFVGNFGSRNIKNFTVMGSNVNLGARLEAFTRTAHWPVIISERTYRLAYSALEARDLGQIQVKGFADAIQIYGLEAVRTDTVWQRIPDGPWMRANEASL